MTKAHIISIGAELTEGRVLNTNATYLAQQIQQMGIGISRITTIGDDINDIVHSLNAPQDILVVTGGLGPTHDDITTDALFQFCTDNFNSFVTKNSWQKTITHYCKTKEINHLHERVCLLKNPVGSAPGVYIKVDKRHIFALPGVPSEAKSLFSKEVEPILKTMSTTYHSHVMRLSGTYESQVQKILKKTNWPKHVEISLLPQYNGVNVVIKSSVEAVAFINDVRSKLQEHIYSESALTLEETISKLLCAQQKTIAVAESCSGGFASHLLTNVPGSSSYFQHGVVSYSNEAKVKILGVRPETIEKYGAVSSECAQEMAQGVRKITQTDIGIATTGISGPTGATPNKPLGLLYVAYADKDNTIVRKKVIRKPRVEHKKHSAHFVLGLLWECLKDKKNDKKK
ncbi:nicotinamide-nucleotide amidohydrolase family protein [Candidatus Uabimicrobium sp. HlEnr_7]|uniref:nicotinamide-nucleotide amidohydrolase family protein n=1 Tax=Candidatus Uabimicrobium helgolandensis TaxID=3095367 RepID=UPI003556C7D4